jgi:hypothetical protein
MQRIPEMQALAVSATGKGHTVFLLISLQLLS